MPEVDPNDLELIKEHTVDFLGSTITNQCVSLRPVMRQTQSLLCWSSSSYEPYVMPGRKINPHRGWEIYEQGLYDIAQNIKRKLQQHRVAPNREWNGS